MNSAAMQGKTRPTGKQYRSGITKKILDNVYKNMDEAFAALERAVNAGWEACACVYDTAENTTFAGGAPATVDTSVTVTVGMRVLVIGQTLQKNNGIYVVDTVGTGVNGTWSRAEDLNSLDEVQLGDEVWVTSGTAYANTAWRVTEIPTVWATTGNLVFTRQLVTSVCGSEGAVDALITGAYIDGDRLKAGGLTATSFKAALATSAFNPDDQVAKWAADGFTAAFLKKVLAVESLDFTDVDIAAAVKAASLPAAKLEGGGNATGLLATQLNRGTAQAVGVVAAPTATAAWVLNIADGSGDKDFTDLPAGKFMILDVMVYPTTATGHASDNYTLKRIHSGVQVISNAMTPGAAAIGMIARAGTLDPTYTTITAGDGLKVAASKNAGSTSSAARMIITVMPIQ